MRGIGVVVIAAAALAGCGAPADNTAMGRQFKAQFAKATHDSCLKAAMAKGAPLPIAEAYCACIVAQTGQLTNQERMSLGMNQDRMRALALACASKLQS